MRERDDMAGNKKDVEFGEGHMRVKRQTKKTKIEPKTNETRPHSVQTPGHVTQHESVLFKHNVFLQAANKFVVRKKKKNWWHVTAPLYLIERCAPTAHRKLNDEVLKQIKGRWRHDLEIRQRDRTDTIKGWI